MDLVASRSSPAATAATGAAAGYPESYVDKRGREAAEQPDGGGIEARFSPPAHDAVVNASAAAASPAVAGGSDTGGAGIYSLFNASVAATVADNSDFARE